MHGLRLFVSRNMKSITNAMKSCVCVCVWADKCVCFDIHRDNSMDDDNNEQERVHNLHIYSLIVVVISQWCRYKYIYEQQLSSADFVRVLNFSTKD